MTTWMAFVSIPTPVATEFGAYGPAHTCYFPLGELTTSFLPSHLAVFLCGFQNKRQTLVYSTTHPKLRSPPLCTPPAAVSAARAPQAFTEAELLRGWGSHQWGLSLSLSRLDWELGMLATLSLRDCCENQVKGSTGSTMELGQTGQG